MEKQEELRESLTDWIVEDSQSANAFTSSKFHQFIYKLDPAFIMPNQETVNTTLHFQNFNNLSKMKHHLFL